MKPSGLVGGYSELIPSRDRSEYEDQGQINPRSDPDAVAVAVSVPLGASSSSSEWQGQCQTDGGGSGSGSGTGTASVLVLHDLSATPLQKILTDEQKEAASPSSSRHTHISYIPGGGSHHHHHRLTTLPSRLSPSPSPPSPSPNPLPSCLPISSQPEHPSPPCPIRTPSLQSTHPRSRAFRYRHWHAEAERETRNSLSPQSRDPSPSSFSPSGLRGLAKRAASIAGLAYSSATVQGQVSTEPHLTEGPRNHLARARRQEKQRRSGVWITPSPSGLRPIGLGLAADPHLIHGSPTHSRSSSISSTASYTASRLCADSDTSITQSPPAAAGSTNEKTSNPAATDVGSRQRSLPSNTKNTSNDSAPPPWILRGSVASSSAPSFAFSGLDSGGQTDSDDSDDKKDSISSHACEPYPFYSSVLSQPPQQIMPPKSSVTSSAGGAAGQNKVELKKGKKDNLAPVLTAKHTATNGEKKASIKRTSGSASGGGSIGAAESEDSDGEGFEDAEGGAGEERDTAAGAGEEAPSQQGVKPTPAAGGQDEGLPEPPLAYPEVSTNAARETASEDMETTPAAPLGLPTADEPAATTPLTARPPPPPPPPRPIATDTSTPRKHSATSLWDRLKSPQDRAAEAPANSIAPPAPLPSAASMQQRQSSSGSILNSLTSAANYAASSAASRGFSLPERLGGGPAAAASLAQTPTQRKRLPQYEIDEGKVMEDSMRFAEARHLLATSTELEQVRSLGKDLESGWREKLAEVTEMHLRLEDLTASVSDIQDENEQLRTQLSSLSEQIALREEDFEAFQRLTIAHQQREKELWNAESKEEKERLEWKEREAVRILAEERALNAQLRLVLLGSLSTNGSGESGPSGAGINSSGLMSKSASSSSSNGRHATSSSAVFDVTDGDSSTVGEELERGSTRDSTYTTSNLGGGGGGEEGAIQDDVLFNLNLSHTANNGGMPASASGSLTEGGTTTPQGTLPNRSAVASLFSDVVPLDQLRLILKLPSEEDEEGAQRILCDAPWMTRSRTNASTDQGSANSLQSPSILQQQQDQPLQAQTPALAPAAPSDFPSSSSSSSSLFLPSTSSSTSLLHYLTVQKSTSDYQLSQALQLENLSLRSQIRDEKKRNLVAEEEVRALQEKVRGMEEAVSGLLNGQVLMVGGQGE